MKRNRNIKSVVNSLARLCVLGIVIASMSPLLGAGCATKVTVIRPFSTEDFDVLTNGVPYTPKKDGYFLSDEYLEQAVEAKLERNR